MSRDDRRSPAAEQYRGRYKTARWQKLAWACYVRDRFTCQRTGELLIGKHPAPDSPVANHKIAHRGDPALFWDMDNIETVSKRHHDSAIQSEEKTGRKAASIGVDGWPAE